MRLPPSAIRFTLGVFAFVMALAGWPGAASAELTVSGATLNGVTSIASPPGGVMNARVTGRAGGGDVWRGTEYRFGSGSRQCVDTTDSSDTRTVEFNVSAPGEPGNYDAGFTARGTNTCGGAASAEKVLTDAVRVTTPAPNPNLPPRCGINVMLVLDESGSIASSGATEQVRSATRAFLTALSGTGARVSIVDFSTTAARPVPYTTVTADSISTVFEPYLRDGYRPNGWTNWEAAFQEVREANTLGTRANLVAFMTDGDPTARNTDSGGTVTNLVEGDVEALGRAAREADLVKGQDSHVFALGVGAAVTKPTSARRLTAISGFDEYPDTEFSQADFTLVKDFAGLAAALRAIAVELCQASVTVTKLVDEGDGVPRPDGGWRFTASVSMSAGEYSWLQPAPPPSTGPRSDLTDDAGVAKFQWKPTNAGATSTVTLVEDVNPGYQFVEANCETIARRGRRVIRRVRIAEPRAVVTIGPNQYARCTVLNRVVPGTIEIEKNATPDSSQAFGFTGSLGPFSLVDDRADGSASKIFTDLAPGTYTVSEIVPDDWELTGVTCTPEAAAVVAGTQVTMTLAPGASVVCTFDDTRIDPPVPPEPPDPPPTPPTRPTPPGPPAPPPESGVLPAQVESTRLRVVKRAPRVARVGQRVRFRLTVTNTGSVAATDVRMVDVPPAAVALASLRAGTRARVVRGSATWRLGTLAPGATRTIRGSVRIKAGTPGLKRNVVLATAGNAPLVNDAADTRLLRQRAAPPVTG